MSQLLNTTTRKGSFDSGHRVMNEKFKCHNHHGHTYLYELTFSWEKDGGLGYALDFKEIKRVACAWIDDFLDHGFIANPEDRGVIDLCRAQGTKLYLMHLNGGDYCNPSAENIAKELFFAVSVLLNRTDDTKFTLSRVRLHETPNCFVDCTGLDLEELAVLRNTEFHSQLSDYKKMKGSVEYDDRKSTEADPNQ